jgi:hypothetical protein
MTLHRYRPDPLPGAMSDSDRNILASLRHEACEGHCADCGACLDFEPDPTEEPLCQDCRYGVPNTPTRMSYAEQIEVINRSDRIQGVRSRPVPRGHVGS